nr:polysaccharide biosynthesis tyrosine autokinase [Mesorhizobium sp.]
MNVNSGRVDLAASGNDGPTMRQFFRAEPDMDLREIVRFLRRQSKLIVITAFSVFAVAALLVFALSPTYKASTLILVDPIRKNILDPISQMTGAAVDSPKVDSEVEILRSDNVLMDVIESEQLVSDEEFGVKIDWRDKIFAALRIAPLKPPTGHEAISDVLEKLRKAVTVSRRGQTYVIGVSVDSERPEKAAELANAIAASYIRLQLQAKVSDMLATRDVVQTQIAEARKKVIEAEGAASRYIETNLDAIINSSPTSELVQIRAALDGLRLESSRSTSLVTDIRQDIASQNWSRLADKLATDASAELLRKRQALEMSLSQAASETNTVDLRKELRDVEGSLKSLGEDRVSAVEASLASMEANRRDMNQRLNAAYIEAAPAAQLAEFLELQSISAKTTATYRDLIAREQELATQSTLQMADSRIVSPALAPAKPSFPNIPLVLGLAGILALGAGVGLGFVFENYVGGFTTAGQVEAVTGYPLVATLPKQALADGGTTVADALVSKPLSRYSENIRRLQALINRTVARRDPAGRMPGIGITILVTSAMAAEGKTTVALSLARSYALAGHSVLIVDGDFRKPSLHRHFRMDLSNGIVDYLSGTLPSEEFSKVVVRDPKTSLVAALGAKRSEVPTDRLVTKNTFTQLLAAASRKYEYVIIDSPPVGPVVDGLYMAEHADAVVFVVKWASTPQRSVVEAIDAVKGACRSDASIFVAMNSDTSKENEYPNGDGYYIE